MTPRFLTILGLAGLVFISSAVTTLPYPYFVRTVAAVSPSVVPLPTLPSLLPTPTPLSEYVLPFPGILPDHPLYVLKVMRDRLVVFFTRDPIRRVEIKLHLADKRLIMGKTLIERDKIQLGSSTISKGEKYLLEAIQDVDLINTTSINPGFLEKMIEATGKHTEVIDSLMHTVSLEDREELGLSLQLVQEAVEQIDLVKKKKM